MVQKHGVAANRVEFSDGDILPQKYVTDSNLNMFDLAENFFFLVEKCKF